MGSNGWTVVIDAGHGGIDGGAYGRYSKESAVVLAIMLLLVPMLRAAGYNVVLTRSRDEYVELQRRADIANAAEKRAPGRVIFLSLHANAEQSKTVRGFETFIYLTAGQRAQALQRAVHSALAPQMVKYGVRDRGMKRANYLVLRNTFSPAVLIEYAFISTPLDEDVLRDYQREMAVKTFEGINAFCGVSPKKEATDVEVIQKQVDKLNSRVFGGEQASLTESWERAKALGITDGSRPGHAITRAEAAAMILRALNAEK